MCKHTQQDMQITVAASAFCTTQTEAAKNDSELVETTEFVLEGCMESNRYPKLTQSTLFYTKDKK